ncbi:DUF305 domain-containing protein [Streptomyces omiyaensis]|uniref:DUF305 domain-containing protein n=1 Tax=Streptomyces omiyaensis TaxID=68247 RepID=UPI001672F7BC|nr:DUF305 domain-containing protein [Streptomyces omiyaensis]GGY37048.1 DUF305 domain-containing protein [Streptomyces omiyaensis]
MQLRRHLLILRTAGALLAALAVTGCTARPVTGPPRAEAFNATDTAWILLMIPMAERAHRLTGLAPSRTADPALADLAARTGERLEEEREGLRALLDLAGVPDTRPHEGHRMPGMVGLDTLARAKGATGGEFDRILVDGLRAHFAQSRALCASERLSGGAEEAKELAAVIGGNAAEALDRLGPRAGPAP